MKTCAIGISLKWKLMILLTYATSATISLQFVTLINNSWSEQKKLDEEDHNQDFI